MIVHMIDLEAPIFYGLHSAIKKHEYTHYWLAGGRGSTKSSFVSLEIILGMMKNPDYNAIVFRKVGAYLKESVYEQLIWSIDKLGVSDYWRILQSPLMLIYKPTGQRVIFRGVDDPKKTKSVKLRKGYFAYAWYEELDEFTGINEINMLNQSVLRGGDSFWVFYSFNPPKSLSAWVNYEAGIPRPDKVVSHSTYLDVPPSWLGPQFIIEAEAMKKQNADKYRHEYLGEAIGTGGNVFDNVEGMVMDKSVIDTFDRCLYGLDFGFAVDPLAFTCMYYDKKHQDLYIFNELYQQKLSNHEACRMIAPIVQSNIITADSAEPKSIAECRSYGLHMQGAKKGKDSVRYGMDWLQGLHRIYIDRKRCPKTYKEFIQYEYERNRDGEFISAFPDKNNHAIDSVRYACEREMPARSRMRIMR